MSYKSNTQHLGGWLILGLSWLLAGTQLSADQPNIVLIMADYLGYRELGSYGQQLIQTPYLDQLAKDGMRFTRNYSGNAVCAPSRCVLMTGQHPGHAYIRNNSEVKPEGQGPIPASTVTLAEVLGELGYVTGAFGITSTPHIEEIHIILPFVV